MRLLALGVILVGMAGCSTVQTLSGTGIVKVLPHNLDAGGKSTDGPTLLHRDVYQNYLRGNPDLVKGVRYDVNWHGRQSITVRLELRSTKAGVQPMTVEKEVAAGARVTHWTFIHIDEENYTAFGQPKPGAFQFGRATKCWTRKFRFSGSPLHFKL